jgi:hypothetical protein
MPGAKAPERPSDEQLDEIAAVLIDAAQRPEIVAAVRAPESTKAAP